MSRVAWLRFLMASEAVQRVKLPHRWRRGPHARVGSVSFCIYKKDASYKAFLKIAARRTYALFLNNSLARPTNRYVPRGQNRSEEHTSELQSRQYLVCRLLLEKKKYVS